MNAKELRDNWNNFGHDIRNLSSESNATILRALDLLAATEGSEDAIVRELREQAIAFMHKPGVRKAKPSK